MNFNFFKWVHDEVTALRAAVARLETHTSSPESKPVPKPADLPADFGPPPVSGNAPAPQPAGPAAPAVPVPLPPGGNTTDPTAPGFIMPTNLPPVSQGPADEPFQLKPVMTFEECQGQAIAFQGSVSFKVTDCPPRVAIWVFQHSGSPAGPYDYTVNGVSKHVDNPVVYDPIVTDGPEVDVQVNNGPYWLNVNVKAGG